MKKKFFFLNRRLTWSFSLPFNILFSNTIKTIASHFWWWFIHICLAISLVKLFNLKINSLFDGFGTKSNDSAHLIFKISATDLDAHYWPPSVHKLNGYIFHCHSNSSFNVPNQINFNSTHLCFIKCLNKFTTMSLFYSRFDLDFRVSLNLSHI